MNEYILGFLLGVIVTCVILFIVFVVSYQGSVRD